MQNSITPDQVEKYFDQVVRTYLDKDYKHKYIDYKANDKLVVVKFTEFTPWTSQNLTRFEFIPTNRVLAYITQEENLCQE